MHHKSLLPGKLTGRYWVRAHKDALKDVDRLLKRTKDRTELRRHVLKLRFFPKPKAGDLCEDISWDRIKTIERFFVCELRIGNRIGGYDNLRVMFWVPETASEETSVIWIVHVFQKKTQKISRAVTDICNARVQLLERRLYGP